MFNHRHIIIALGLLALQACGGGGDAADNPSNNSGRGNEANQQTPSTDAGSKTTDTDTSKDSDCQNNPGADKNCGGSDSPSQNGDDKNKPTSSFYPDDDPVWTKATVDDTFRKVPAELAGEIERVATFRFSRNFTTDDSESLKLNVSAGEDVSMLKDKGHHVYKGKTDRNGNRDDLYVFRGRYGAVILLRPEANKDTRYFYQGVTGLDTTEPQFKNLAARGVVAKYRGIAQGNVKVSNLELDKFYYVIDFAKNEGRGVVTGREGAPGHENDNPIVKVIELQKGEHVDTSKDEMSSNRTSISADAVILPTGGKTSYSVSLFGPEANEVAGSVQWSKDNDSIGLWGERIK